MQILFAATSSSLSWTGAASGGFSVIAFSLGGGITMSFAAHFPYLINSIVLLAPAGLLRSLPDGYGTSFFSYPDLIPFSYLRKLVGRILGVSFNPGPNSRDSRSGPDRSGSEGAQKAKVLEKLSMDMPAIVQWQFDNHKGFVLSFIDTIKHGPLMHQHQDWVKVCNIIRGTRALTSSTDHSTKLFNSKMLVIFGDADGVVLEKELSADLLEMIGGPEHVDFKVVPGSHGFPFPSSDEIVGHISDFWGLKLDTS